MDQVITIVSGLPRSGTSMMMSMLEAGGLQLMTDSLRIADQDNPKGYYEFERVKALPDGDVEWLPAAQGKALKVIAALVPYLPDTYTYRILFMRRAMPEILASQRKMLLNRGQDPNKFDDAVMTSIYEKHLKQIDIWMGQQTNLRRMDINYNQLLADPIPQIEAINHFLGDILNVTAMLTVIDPHLYRQREAK